MFDFLEKMLNYQAADEIKSSIQEDAEVSKGSEGADTVRIRIPPDIYFTEMALYNAKNLIAKAISSCEFRVYKNNQIDKTCLEYFTLNESPNRNQNASEFWSDVIHKVLGDNNSALVVQLNDMLFCAETYAVDRGFPVAGNIYSGVSLESCGSRLQLNRKFRYDECMLFKFDNEDYNAITTGLMGRYSELMATAISAFKNDGSGKYKLHVDAEKQGDEDFISEFEEKIAGQLADFLEPGAAVFVEFEGYNLTETTKTATSSVSAKNILEIKENMFNSVADSLNIPRSLMNGTINNIDDVVTELMTFAIDPFAKMISRTLNKYSGYEEYAKGNRFEVYTGAVKHHDILDAAVNLDKLYASGVTNQDENRNLVGLPERNTPESKSYVLTKNYGKLETLMNEGGEQNG